MLKKINFILSSIIPQKLYWHLVGLIHPWSSVVEGVDAPADLYKQSHNLVKLLNKLKLVDRDSEVLDIGCGVGRLEYDLAKIVKSCVGIDIAPSMIILAKKYVQASNIKFLIVNGKDLTQLKDVQFDLIFSIIVFQHLPRNIFKNYIRESYKHLRKNGNLFFQIPVYQDNKPTEPPLHHPWAIRSYTLKQLEQILNKAGFTKISFYNMSGEKSNGQENQVFVLGIKKTN